MVQTQNIGCESTSGKIKTGIFHIRDIRSAVKLVPMQGTNYVYGLKNFRLYETECFKMLGENNKHLELKLIIIGFDITNLQPYLKSMF